MSTGIFSGDVTKNQNMKGPDSTNLATLADYNRRRDVTGLKRMGMNHLRSAVAPYWAFPSAWKVARPVGGRTFRSIPLVCPKDSMQTGEAERLTSPYEMFSALGEARYLIASTMRHVFFFFFSFF